MSVRSHEISFPASGTLGMDDRSSTTAVSSSIVLPPRAARALVLIEIAGGEPRPGRVQADVLGDRHQFGAAAAAHAVPRVRAELEADVRVEVLAAMSSSVASVASPASLRGSRVPVDQVSWRRPWEERASRGRSPGAPLGTLCVATAGRSWVALATRGAGRLFGLPDRRRRPRRLRWSSARRRRMTRHRGGRYVRSGSGRRHHGVGARPRRRPRVAGVASPEPPSAGPVEADTWRIT
jgi:hypothetical protein